VSRSNYWVLIQKKKLKDFSKSKLSTKNTPDHLVIKGEEIAHTWKVQSCLTRQVSIIKNSLSLWSVKRIPPNYKNISLTSGLNIHLFVHVFNIVKITILLSWVAIPLHFLLYFFLSNSFAFPNHV
jgi:hypothetical protein